MTESLTEVTEAFRVYRNMIDEIKAELQEQKEEWASDIVEKVVEEVNTNIIGRVMEQVEPDRIWEDLTDK